MCVNIPSRFQPDFIYCTHGHLAEVLEETYEGPRPSCYYVRSGQIHAGQTETGAPPTALLFSMAILLVSTLSVWLQKREHASCNGARNAPYAYEGSGPALC